MYVKYHEHTRCNEASIPIPFNVSRAASTIIIIVQHYAHHFSISFHDVHHHDGRHRQSYPKGL